MAKNNVVLRFDEVTFHYDKTRPLLDEASFSVRDEAKMALMGQNGAGKSTLFKLILGREKPVEGRILRTPEDATVGIAAQVVPEDQLGMTVRDWFASFFEEVPYNLDKRIADALEAVNFNTDLGQKVGEHSGGQKARLLLASSIIREPDILLLDEPTNNLDQDGIDHLTGFLMMYPKTVIVISHDADFLNAFTDGVLYLDSHTRKVEAYEGNYYNVVEEIKARIERERMQNARAEAKIREKKAQAGVFAHKGGKLRSVAKRMREEAAKAEETMVEVRQEDKTIRAFHIPAQEFPSDFNGRVLELPQLDLTLRRNMHVLVSGPNGIGKSTLLENIASGEADGMVLGENVRVGYYRQDLSTLDPARTAYDSLAEVMEKDDEHQLRSAAAGFLLDGKALASHVGSLSEGQKGLLLFCRLVLMKPGLLILDEPTNHINFRHLPVIAEALDAYEGAMMLVSHIPDFVSKVRIDTEIDLARR